MKKQIIVILLISTLALCGCSHSTIETNAHPLVIAYDYDEGLYTEAGFYYLYSGNDIRTSVIKTTGETAGEAAGKKSNYSFDMVNYSILSAIAFGEKLLEKGIQEAVTPLLVHDLPSADILLCATMGTIDELMEIQPDLLPLLLDQSDTTNLLPMCTLSDYVVAINQGYTLLLPIVVAEEEPYVDGAVILQDGKQIGTMDAKDAALWSILFYKSTSGILTTGGITGQCDITRTVRDHGQRIELNIACRELIGSKDSGEFLDSLVNDISAFLDRYAYCDTLRLGPQLGFGGQDPNDFASVTVGLTINK